MKPFRRWFFLILAACSLPLFAHANLTFTRTTTGATAGQYLEQGAPPTARLVEIRAFGTFGGTTLTVQTSHDGGTTWIESGVTFTAAGVDYLYIVRGDQVRVTATGGTSISVTVRVR